MRILTTSQVMVWRGAWLPPVLACTSTLIAISTIGLFLKYPGSLCSVPVQLATTLGGDPLSTREPVGPVVVAHRGVSWWVIEIGPHFQVPCTWQNQPLQCHYVSTAHAAGNATAQALLQTSNVLVNEDCWNPSAVSVEYRNLTQLMFTMEPYANTKCLDQQVADIEMTYRQCSQVCWTFSATRAQNAVLGIAGVCTRCTRWKHLTCHHMCVSHQHCCRYGAHTGVSFPQGKHTLSVLRSKAFAVPLCPSHRRRMQSSTSIPTVQHSRDDKISCVNYRFCSNKATAVWRCTVMDGVIQTWMLL